MFRGSEHAKNICPGSHLEEARRAAQVLVPLGGQCGENEGIRVGVRARWIGDKRSRDEGGTLPSTIGQTMLGLTGFVQDFNLYPKAGRSCCLLLSREVTILLAFWRDHCHCMIEGGCVQEDMRRRLEGRAQVEDGGAWAGWWWGEVTWGLVTG